MTTWTPLGTFELKAQQIEAPWVKALNQLHGTDAAFEFTHLRFTATGKWQVLPGLSLQCGPDGYCGIPADPATLPVATAWPGALIGKIGGSSATLDLTKVDDPVEAAKLPHFAIGSLCVIALADQPKGPLFIGINIRSRPLTVESLTLTVEAVKLA